MWRKGNPHALLVGLKIGAVTMENRKEATQKLKIELPYDPEIPLLVIYPKESKTLKRYMHPYVHCSIICNSQDVEATKCPPIDNWVKKWCIHPMEYYWAITKNGILPLVTTWMDSECITLSEISQTGKDKYHRFSLYMKSKKQN